MQTFLPYKDFKKTASILDYKRLGKQRVEAKQILDTLEGRSKGCKQHPIVDMWRGYELALKVYFNIMSIEWMKRGYKQTMMLYNISRKRKIEYPEWLGDKKFHRSHQSNLLRKDYEYYKKYFKRVPGNLPYVWVKNV